MMLEYHPMHFKEKIQNEDTNEIIEKSHFTTIKNLSRLFHGSKHDKGLYCCKNVIVNLNQKKN